ncbi:carbohydrate ABC transporter substrate-binding protein (CUT1 family) [Lachnotalea glycerini]|uniref:Carbohydrate ABC transporter substrate-binding protein (CUT1 family) n=1 Tax=Lachnotalea glycerini TaxID=1763509 RepID=A0A318EMX2_9FIRM|nr:extracellular solute-binding protein [Lachnotalea glycerini]PXV86723.1 carbohydrate ABC transporter substrate-binding protein (CUT1 family) [Lachnotalea glycerini]
MKKFYKKLTALGMAALMCVPTAACGGKKESNTSANATKDYVYVPEYKTVSETSDISNVVINNNMIYYSVWDYDDATQVSSAAIKTMELGGTEGKTLPIEIGENDNVYNICTDNDGNLIIVMGTYNTSEDIDEYLQTYSLKKYDKDGTELFTMDLSGMMSEDNAYIQYACVDGDGNIYLSNGENKIWLLDAQGNQVGSIDVTNYLQSMGVTKEGKVVVATYGTENIVLQDVDFASKSLGATYDNVPNPYGNLTILKGIDKGCLINSGNSLFNYDFDTQKSEEILNWIDSDIDSDNIVAVSVLDDGRIFALTRNNTEENSSTEMIYLTKTASSEVTQKTIITYGTVYMSSRVRSEIINFNKTNEKYRIQPKEYGSDDYEAGMAQMNSDIVSGNSPDIIDLSSGSTNLYIEKGVLEDLYPYFDNDTELKKEDYVENVLKAYERDGKLYAILPSFSLSTIIGKTADVGDKQGWTLDDMIALVNSKPEGTEVFQYATKDSILTILCMYGMDQFVDWQTGKCSFDSDTFMKLLEFANTFKSEFNYDENEPSEVSKIRDGSLLLSLTDIGDVQTYQIYETMFGEPINCVGYPTQEGTGTAISIGGILLGISSKSSNKEGAWEFVKRFLTSDYQNSSDVYSFPILKTALDAKFQEAMTPEYYVDENGNQTEATKTSWGFGDVNLEVYAATQEQVDAVKSLIDSADSAYEYNEEMFSIITEEAAAFFAGQKDAKAVADVIQSRVQIYVNENK